MPARILAGAMCVQRFDDSLNSAIHITYRISLRSSSMPEPRDPLLKVLICFVAFRLAQRIHMLFKQGSCGPRRAPWVRGTQRPGRSAEATVGKVHKGLGVVLLTL